MEVIKVMEKPDWVSWDDIHELLLAAHKKNIEKGMAMGVPQLSGEELRKRIGEEGKCFVALDDNKLVGTTAVSYYWGTHWYDKGKLVAHGMASGILPRYQGIGIYEDLNRLMKAHIREMKADLIHADTAENNEIMRKSAKRDGFFDVDFRFVNRHYSVVFVKWLHECPFAESYIKRRFKMSKALIKMQYIPEKGERSKIVSLFCIVIRKFLCLL